MIYSLSSLGGIGVIAASILYVASKKFKVEENPKIDEVEEALPAANCGGCGFPGCRPFAEATVNAQDLSTLNCPVGGNETMAKVASILGMEVIATEPKIAVLRCNGSYENSPTKVNYEGASSCLSAHTMYAGAGGCPHGCLGLGDCVDVCNFDALHMDEKTGLPVVDEDKCVACNACVEICPRILYELRPKGPSGKRVYVACMNEEKGAVSKKNCKVACIGCTKCAKIYDSGDKVVIKNALSYIAPDIDIDNFGSEIVGCCPTNAILGVRVEGKKPEPKKPKPVAV